MPKTIEPGRTCSECKSDKTYMKWGKYADWKRRNDKWYCHRCYIRIFISPKNNPSIHAKWNPRKINYKGKQVYMDFNIRSGICSECGYIGKTDIHHTNYHDNDILKDTIELCRACHAKKRIGMKYSKKIQNNLPEISA